MGGSMSLGSIGYAGGSTVEQNLGLQRAALAAPGCSGMFIDHGVSGTTARRPELGKLLDQL